MCPKIKIETYSFKDKKALARVDYNVPLNEEFKIQDTKRIDASLPTLTKILDDGGSIILMSHLGRPKNKEYQFSLRHLIPYLNNVLPDINIYFAQECIGGQAEKIASAEETG